MELKINSDHFSKVFDGLKTNQLNNLDASRKSSFDSHIQSLCDKINNSHNYFTTSSCSGRFLAFSQDENYIKKNCEWLYVSHDPLNEKEIDNFINLIINSKSREISIKFEPFILHVCCRHINAAKLMLEKAVASGYRNSGLSLGSSKIILAVRSTQNLEIPIVAAGNMLVDEKYLRHICEQVREKFADNFERIDRFLTNIEICFQSENIEKQKSKKELKALERLNKKLMYDELKSTGKLTTTTNKKSKNITSNNYEEIDNLFSFE